MLNLTCPQCEQPLALEDDRRGKPVRCAQCGLAFRAPVFDGEPPTGYTLRGNTADHVALVATLVGVVGLIATGIMFLAIRQKALAPLPPNLMYGLFVPPVAVIVASWYASGRTTKPTFVWLSRTLAYLWVLLLVAMLMILL